MGLSLELNEDELFYKEYFGAARDQEAFDRFVSSLSVDEVRRRKLIVPELAPDAIPNVMEDTEYFPEDAPNSVFVSRHNRYTPPFLHRHVFFEITVIYSGSCMQALGMGSSRFEAGDVVFLAPGVYHTMEVFDDEGIVFNVLLRRATFKQVFASIMSASGLLGEFFEKGVYGDNNIRYLVFHTGEDSGLLHDVFDLWREQESHPDAFTDQLMVGTLERDFALLMRHQSDTAEISMGEATSPQASFPIMSYIEQNVATVTLDDVARHFNLSAPYCSRLIKSSTGRTLSEWRRSIRMQRAKRMLATSGRTVYQISQELGYANPETFIRGFRKEFSMTPSAYRKTVV